MSKSSNVSCMTWVQSSSFREFRCRPGKRCVMVMYVRQLVVRHTATWWLRRCTHCSPRSLVTRSKMRSPLSKNSGKSNHEIICSELCLRPFLNMSMHDSADQAAILLAGLPQQGLKLRVVGVVDNRGIRVQVVPEKPLGEEISRDVVLGWERRRGRCHVERVFSGMCDTKRLFSFQVISSVYCNQPQQGSAFSETRCEKTYAFALICVLFRGRLLLLSRLKNTFIRHDWGVFCASVKSQDK